MLASKATGAQGVALLWVPAILFGCAAGLVVNPLPVEPEIPVPAPLPAWATSTSPVRQPSLRPDYAVGVFTYRCQECHRVIVPSTAGDSSRTQHAEIQLQHGMNTRCLNCHHPANRDAFVDDFGHEIPWDQPQLLCAKCHGPVYRDWQHGSHGRSNGYWDKARGPQERRKCIECHDPHKPPFPPLASAPPPNTLRMGPQKRHAAEAPNPLRSAVGIRPVEAGAPGH